jgi:putative effector of murein hydrolase
VSFQILAFVGTVAAYALARFLHQRAPLTLRRNMPPLLVGLVLVAALVYGVRIPWEQYKSGSDPLIWCLGPATVALVLPLSQSRRLLANFRPILGAIVLGCLANLLWTLLVCRLLQVPAEWEASLRPKTSTSAIAIQIAGLSHGVPATAAAFSVLGGLVGSWLYPILASQWRDRPTSLGIAVGTVSHGIGTSRLASEAETPRDNEATGASAFAMAVAGVVTALLLLPWML